MEAIVRLIEQENITTEVIDSRVEMIGEEELGIIAQMSVEGRLAVSTNRYL